MPLIITLATQQEEQALARAGHDVTHLDRFQLWKMLEVDPGDPPRGYRYVLVFAPLPLQKLLYLPPPPAPTNHLRLVR